MKLLVEMKLNNSFWLSPQSAWPICATFLGKLVLGHLCDSARQCNPSSSNLSLNAGRHAWPLSGWGRETSRDNCCRLPLIVKVQRLHALTLSTPPTLCNYMNAKRRINVDLVELGLPLAQSAFVLRKYCTTNNTSGQSKFTIQLHGGPIECLLVKEEGCNDEWLWDL